jgi:hypothetical protein
VGRAAVPKPIFKHWWQILCTIRSDSNTNAHFNSNSKPDRYGNSDRRCNRYTNAVIDASNNTDAKEISDAQKSTNASAAPIENESPDKTGAGLSSNSAD